MNVFVDFHSVLPQCRATDPFTVSILREPGLPVLGFTDLQRSSAHAWPRLHGRGEKAKEEEKPSPF